MPHELRRTLHSPAPVMEKAPSPDQDFEKKIGKLLDSGKDVSILVIANDAPLYWGPFHVDLAAGLEKIFVGSS